MGWGMRVGILATGLWVGTTDAARNISNNPVALNIGRYTTGEWNGITDVRGVQVGHVTIHEGQGPLTPGQGPIRTGVTVILPTTDNIWLEKLVAGGFVLNGNGEATGLMWVEESGILETPIALTNTLAVGTVQKALVQWMLQRDPRLGIQDDTMTPVVLECDDSGLNDIRGLHVKEHHVFQALSTARSGPVPEGSVGAGTGMIAYGFKSGIGTSSRRVHIASSPSQDYTLGVLLNSNHGRRHQLRFGGLNRSLWDTVPLPKIQQEGSIVVVLATDAPLDARQLKRLAKRAMLGVARTGAIGQHGSGDVAIAFSTANRIPHYPKSAVSSLSFVSDFWINDLFEAAADATEEAVLRALLASRTVEGRDGHVAHGFPAEALAKHLDSAHAH